MAKNTQQSKKKNQQMKNPVASGMRKLAAAVRDDEVTQRKFEAFTRELAKLSKEHGVSVRSVGGVEFGDIASISYDDDYTSGDLIPKTQWKQSTA